MNRVRLMSLYQVSYVLFYSVLLTLNLIVSGFWISYLLVQLKKYHASYMQAVTRLNSKSSQDNERCKYKYLIRSQMLRSDEIKCISLLVIFSVESLAAVSIWIAKFLPYSDLTLKFDNNFTEKVNSCDVNNQYRYIDLSHFYNFGLTQMLYVLPAVCFLISLGLGISLMKLIALRTKYPDAWRRVRRSYYCWLAGSFSLIILFVLLTALPYTRIFSMPLYIIVVILYLQQYYVNIKRLRIALEQYAVQQLIQNGNYRLELKQVSRFKITSNIVFTSFLLLTVALIIDELLFDITTLLYFGKCYFPLIYGTAFEPILTTMGVNPGGDGGDASPPTFWSGGDTYINCPPHFLSGLDSSIVVLKYCFNKFTRIK